MRVTMAHFIALLLFLLLIGADAARIPDILSKALGWSPASTPSAPNFPDSYEMEYVFSMPYFLLLQPGGLSYKVHVWVDKAHESVRIDMRDGVDKTYFIGNEEYSVTPHVHDLACKKYEHGGGPIKQPGSDSMPAGMLGKQVLPDMSPWVDMGSAEVDDTPARMYQYKNMAGEKVNTYTFYISKDGVPLKFHSIGQDYFQGSHYDEYNYKWISYKPGPIDPSVFDLPQMCKDLPSNKQQQQQQQQQPMKEDAEQEGGESERHHHAMKAISVLPGNHHEHADEAHYHLHCHFHGTSHDSTSTYTQRLDTFKHSKAKIMAHNMKAAKAAAGSQTLELNHFADWSREEFDRVMLPLKWKRDHGFEVQKVRPPALYTFKPSLSKKELPKKLDWRATPADFAVKDQGQCGSCWAFAAVGTMEGAWYTATGEPRSFSEQQLIDCAWPHGPHGCDGGDYQPGFRYVAKLGGIAATQDYPYVGQNDYCRDDTSKMTGHFDGYVEVPSKDESAVMEALMKHGPLAVGVDASFDEFLFHSEGVYRDRRCSLKPAELNHAVILVGWGTDKETHEDYWIVKNSWSKFWGDDGYIKIHRGGNDCGIASDAAFARVVPQYVVPGAAEKALATVLAASSNQQDA